jgi:hypothetical protein
MVLGPRISNITLQELFLSSKVTPRSSGMRNTRYIYSSGRGWQGQIFCSRIHWGPRPPPPREAVDTAGMDVL